MSPSIFEIFCIFLAASGVAHSSYFNDDLQFHKLAQVYDHWDLKSWKDQHDNPFMRFYQRKYVIPDPLNVFYKYPLYHIEEFPNDKSQDVKLPSTSFKSGTREKNSLASIINSVPSLDLASNSISSTSLEKTNPESSEISENTFLYDNSNIKTEKQDETHPSSTENITSTELVTSSNSTNRESLSTENAEDLNNSINSTSEDNTYTSDSAPNSETVEDHQPLNTQSTSVSDTDSSSVQSTVSSTNNSRYSISNTPNLTTNESNVDGISSTSFKPLTEEYTQSTDSENVYSTFTDPSTETTTIMTSEDKDTILTKMPKPSTSETVFLPSKSTILTTRGSHSSVSYMTSSSNKGTPTVKIYSTSTDELGLHEHRDRLIIAEPETVIEISSIKTAKIVVSTVFLSIALVATAVLTVYMIKVKRREVQYDQLTLLP